MGCETAIRCICLEKGCEHLMSWHAHTSADEIECRVPGCFCYTRTICGHVSDPAPVSDVEFALELGIEL